MTQTFFYRFSTRQEALDAFAPISIDGAFELEFIAVDVIDVILKETGETAFTEDGFEYPVTVPLPWFHLNTTEQLTGFSAYEVFPVTPYRVFM